MKNSHCEFHDELEYVSCIINFYKEFLDKNITKDNTDN